MSGHLRQMWLTEVADCTGPPGFSTTRSSQPLKRLHQALVLASQDPLSPAPPLFRDQAQPPLSLRQSRETCWALVLASLRAWGQHTLLPPWLSTPLLILPFPKTTSDFTPGNGHLWRQKHTSQAVTPNINAHLRAQVRAEYRYPQMRAFQGAHRRRD